MTPVCGQNEETVPGSIKVDRCHDCEDLIIKLPDVSYPAYVGYGPHTFEGEVGVQIVIDENGDIKSAKGISGHRYFRPMLEKASLAAKFKRTIVDGKPVKKTAVIFYKITPPKKETELVERTPKHLGIINGRATSLPKPAYTRDMENLCANGKVEIEVLINEKGNVLDAKAISGDELLHETSLAAAKKAKFRPYIGPESKGLVVFNFPSKLQCIDGGVLNGRWRDNPKFEIPPHAEIEEELDIDIRMTVELVTGRVTAAKAISGPLTVRTALEKTAMQVKFSSFYHGASLHVKGILKLKIKPDGSVVILQRGPN
ncbi:MAG: energy transducer TonB [Acidobacteria bacterium]|nr:energy transducer TonB [Acidobacteriota bacterium]